MTYQGNELIAAVVTRVVDEATDVRSYEFSCEDGWPLPPHTAGSHLDILLPSGRTRQYSLCCDPIDRKSYRIAVLNSGESEGGSYEIHQQLRVGTPVGLSLPRNHFPLADLAARHVFIAGGIGITPFISMIPILERAGADWELHYCIRSSDRAAFLGYLTSSQRARSVHLYVGNERRLDIGSLLAVRGETTHVYCCGPQAMVDEFVDQSSHWPEGTAHHERFGAVAPQSGTPAYSVKLGLSGQIVNVEAGQNMLMALKGHGIPLKNGCEAGICRICKVSYSSGTPTHRDYVLTPEERKTCLLPCVTFAPAGDLVLDL